MNNLRFILFISSYLLIHFAAAQHKLSGVIFSSDDNSRVHFCKISLNDGKYVTITDSLGNFIFSNLPAGTYHISISDIGYKPYKKTTEIHSRDKHLNIELEPEHKELKEITLSGKSDKFMRGVENMGIYEGKKSEVIVPDKLVANLATNNARQVYSRVPGLNIWENDGAGLQLSIGGRGLDPNRTSNFNVRQNGYDISADALGYPESYYTPPVEAIEKIQIVRGAASLQYGTQFGGLLNFILRKPVEGKKIHIIARQTAGSFGFYNTFTSASGTIGKLSYYSFFQYKRGNGWRPNSHFDNTTFYANINYDLSAKTKVKMDITSMYYLAQQPGGLTDAMFLQDARQSNRERNWFKVRWNMLAFHFNHKFSTTAEFNLRLFGLSAYRYSLGFRPVRVEMPDDEEYLRDLIKGNFRNWGAEGRFLKRYTVAEKVMVLLVGVRYYHGFSQNTQGDGATGKKADFNYVDDNIMKNDYRFPNRNVALFAEHIIDLTDKLSITPGVRFEYINTKATGTYSVTVPDLTGKIDTVLYNNENRNQGRQFLLAGIGVNYKFKNAHSIYANISQNYRSITFSDMQIKNTSSVIDPDLKDEKGYSADLGFRGDKSGLFVYDVSLFLLNYNNRIGEINKKNAAGQVIRYRSNIGQALMSGIESYLESDILHVFKPEIKNWHGVLFSNMAFINSVYTKSEEVNVEGNRVEFVPAVNIKTGARAEFKKIKFSYQLTYLSKQYTDALNTEKGSSSAVTGIIPSYKIMDISASYEYKRYKLEGSVNNLTNKMYYTRRATGYPGPGILPSDGRSFYLTLQVKI
jgi:Fe(3+) dicitrate transport protein